MRRLKKDTRAVVTVMVTLLLIPSLLLSGTAVDLSRIHAAKSAAQNANQLAGNAVLTQYNALLQDLYGLYGIAKNDPELAEMVDKYVQIIMFSESSDDRWVPTGFGTFRPYAGSSVTTVLEPNPSDSSGPGTNTTGMATRLDTVNDYNLGNAHVLRRQIEEYMKIRGPVILIQELLGILSQEAPGLKANHEVIEQQKVVSEKLSEFFQLIFDLYDAIVAADKCKEDVEREFDKVNDRFGEIKEAFEDLKERYEAWFNKINEADEKYDYYVQIRGENPDLAAQAYNEWELAIAEAEELKEMYNRKLKHIEILAKGGEWSDLREGNEQPMLDEDGEPIVVDSYTMMERVPGGDMPAEPREDSIAKLLENVQTKANEYTAATEEVVVNGETVRVSKFQKVLTLSEQIDAKRGEVREEINELREKLAQDNVKENIRDSLNEMIDDIESMLNEYQDFTGLARTYKNGSDVYVNTELRNNLNRDFYYNSETDNPRDRLSISQLSVITENEDFQINEDPPRIHPDDTEAARFMNFTTVYRVVPEFKKYEEYSDEHRALYNRLAAMKNEADDITVLETIDGIDTPEEGNNVEKQEGILKQLETLADNITDGFRDEPEGARKIEDGSVSATNWGRFDIESDIVDWITDPGVALQEAIGSVLLLTYGTSMFSSYTTRKPASLKDSAGRTIETKHEYSAANIKMSPRVNYFYQSEWEYLLRGEQDAEANLKHVRLLIYGIRVVCNFIAAFQITEISNIATSIQSACAAIPYVGVPLGWFLYFLTFTAFAAAESAYDITVLRNGCKVPLIKDTDSWKCKPTGVVRLLRELGSSEPEYESVHNNEKGLSYENYLVLFFAVSLIAFEGSEDTLAERIGNLIKWNVTNYSENVNTGDRLDDNGHVKADEAAAFMKTKLYHPETNRNGFHLANMQTDFNITTTVDLRMIFFTIPNNKIEISVTDYRGY